MSNFYLNIVIMLLCVQDLLDKKTYMINLQVRPINISPIDII